jgi:hypothetical protein
MKPFSPASKLFVLFSSISFLCTVGVLGQDAAGNNHANSAAELTQSITRVTAEHDAGKPTSDPPKAGTAATDLPTQTSDKRKPVQQQNAAEDWTTLKVSPDQKGPDPFPPMRSEFPEFTREFVQLTWRPGDLIDLYVLKPAGFKKPPLILYLYSFPKTTEAGFKDNDFAKLLTKNGFAAVGFVSALTGPRYHDRPMKQWFVSELQEALAASVHDVQLILNYLDQRGDLDMSRVGMFADGSGASIAIMAASVDPRIKALDLLNPWGDWPDWMAKSTLIQLEDERAEYVKPEFLKKVENLDPVKYLPQLTTQRVRLQYLDMDTVTPKSAWERIKAAAPPNAVVAEYPNLKALGKTFGFGPEFTSKLFEWIQMQVVAPSSVEQSTQAGNLTQSPAAKASNK